MIEVRKYKEENQFVWNNFIANSKNATFLFKRDFMDYHKDRFIDYSLLIYKDNKLVAVLPANLDGETTIISHAGLTYGGLVLDKKIGLNTYLEIVKELLEFLINNNITRLKLKVLPVFYTNLPAQEIQYAMFLLNAKKYRVDTALAVVQEEQLTYQTRRKRSIKKANTPEFSILKTNDFKEFWNTILTPNLLTRFKTKPVHSLKEIEQLALSFPENIHQFNIYKNDVIVAGCTIFETESVAHAQYISANDIGRTSGALDKLFDFMIKEEYVNKIYFDFGICNESEGRKINHGLLDWKEGFGARTFVHEFYEINTNNFYLIDNILKND